MMGFCFGAQTMSNDFQIQALPIEPFQALFELGSDSLQQHNAQWLTVDADPGYPCRVSLTDAKLGERVLALPYTHHDVASPYRASGPIFVREQAARAQLPPNSLPQLLRHRLLSVRAYNADHLMIAAVTTEGTELEAVIHALLQNQAVRYLHVHNAHPGCFMCSVHRVTMA